MRWSSACGAGWPSTGRRSSMSPRQSPKPRISIVTRVTLDIESAFTMRQDAFEGLAWASLLADLGAVMSAGYSVSLFTAWSGPTVTRWWIKTRLEDNARDVMPVARLGAALAAQPPLRATAEAMQRINPF